MWTSTLLLCSCLCQQPDEEANSPKPPEPMPVPRVFLQQRAPERQIVIDGSLLDWPEMRAIGLDDVRQLSGTAFGAWRDPTDLVARVFMLWDEEAIYIAANVLDDWHIALKKTTPRLSEIPPVDSLLVTFDPLQDTRGPGTVIGRDDDLVVWAADVEGQGRRLVVWDRANGSASFSEGAEVVVRRDQDKRQTYYEMRVPFAEILPEGVKAEPGVRIDVQIILDDLDEPTDPIAQTRLGWTFGTGLRIDPDVSGTVVLSDVTPEFAREFELANYEPKPDEPKELPDLPPFQTGMWDRMRVDLRSGAPARWPQPEPVLETDRSRAIELLETELAKFPRVDHLLMHHRIHRRMRREVGGMTLRGLPYLWQEMVESIREDLRLAPPEVGVRLIRLPLGGYVVVSRYGNFAIDPAGPSIDQLLGDVVDFVILTEPYDVTRRNDQLLTRLVTADAGRKIFLHLPLHLPNVKAGSLPLSKVGTNVAMGQIQVEPIGVLDDDGRIASSLSYLVRFPGDFELLIAAPSFEESLLRLTGPLDAALVSLRHPRARVVVHRIDAGLTIWSDFLACASDAGASRVPLDFARGLAQSIFQHQSVLMVPGDLLDLRVRDD